MAGISHRIRHWLHWQPIEVVSEWRGIELWIGARCVICGEVTGWHAGHYQGHPMRRPRYPSVDTKKAGD